MSNPPSLARQFYESIVRASDPVAAIRKVCDPAEPQFETDYLEFKQYDQQALKGQLRQALCGFSNNQGGVLVWGIDARPRGDPPVDAACGERPVPNPQAIKSRLLELQNGAVDPPVANVEVEALESAPGSGVGFVIAYIPDGPFKPYRATDGMQPFWFRAGSSFVPMPTSMIRHLFYPQSLAAFRVVGQVSVCATVRRREHLLPGKNASFVDVNLSIENIGGGTAASTFVELSVATQAEFDPDVESGAIWKMNNANAPIYTFQSRRRIHPERLETLFWIGWDIPTSGLAHDYLGKSVQLRIVVYSENQQAQKFFCQIDATRLRKIGDGFALDVQSVERLPPWPDQ